MKKRPGIICGGCGKRITPEDRQAYPAGGGYYHNPVCKKTAKAKMATAGREIRDAHSP